jgi:hypothetical protein
MCFGQNLLTDDLVTRDTNPVLAPTYSLLILTKLGGFASLHYFAKSLDHGAALLGLADLIFEIILYPQLA